MKKIISFLGALLIGTAAMTQNTKPDTTKKTTTKKVMPGDVKKTSDPDSTKYKRADIDIKIGGNKK